MSVSGRPKRTVCSACGARCRVEPVEVLFHHQAGRQGYWQWFRQVLCPPCGLAQRDFWARPINGRR